MIPGGCSRISRGFLGRNGFACSSTARRAGGALFVAEPRGGFGRRFPGASSQIPRVFLGRNQFPSSLRYAVASLVPLRHAGSIEHLF